MRSKSVLRIALLGSVLLVATTSYAQQPAPAPPPNPLDNVPEKMPFDVPYGTPIGLDRAQAAIAATVAEAKSATGSLTSRSSIRAATWSPFSAWTARRSHRSRSPSTSARAAAVFRRETKAFENGIQGGNNYLITLDGVIGSRGGIPLLEGGKLIGAIGCSGGTGSQDEVACKVGAATVK